MTSPLSDHELNLAVWLYDHRPFFQKGAVYALIVAAFILFAALLFQIALLAVSFVEDEPKVSAYTAHLLSAVDPASPYFPKALESQQIMVASHQNGGADFLVEVRNPNTTWMAFLVEYVFIVEGVEQTPKRSFVIPGTTWFAGFATDAGALTEPVLMEIRRVVWRKVSSTVDKERLSLFHLVVRDQKFIPGDKETVIDAVEAVLFNDSAFSYWNGEVVVAVYKNNQLLAVGEGKIEQFKSGEVRAVEIGLQILPVDEVDRIEIVPRVNIFDQQNIMQEDLTDGNP